MYDAMVYPVLTYGAGVWGTSEYGCINTVENKARRQFLAVPARTPNMVTWGDMGGLSTTSKLKLEVIRL
jgi:hypothetical protein